MTEDEYAAYRVHAERDYADEISASGAMSSTEAEEKARADYARLLPDGLSSPDMFLWTAYDGEEPVGLVWLNITERPTGPKAFVYDVRVRPEQRRRGYGRAIMLAAEDRCRDRGAESLSLNVFGGNQAARSLYEQLGYVTTAVHMTKPLGVR
jgi:ribosomal protein S18 acetylase RimI-like enzyme